MRVRDSFLVLRDTLHSITASAARLQRELQGASNPVLTSAARRVGIACSTSLRGVDGARQGMFAGRPATGVPMPRRTSLDRSFIQLRAALNQCSIDFAEMGAPGKAQRVRDAGMSRVLPTQAAIRDFESAGDVFLRSLGVRVRPYGAGESALAGGNPPANH